jgi:hypothetical protein
MNFNSIAPDKYKKGVIMNFLHRAYKICSSWSLFHQEVLRIKQLLVNNNFPIKLIDDTIHRFMKNKFDIPIKANDNETIKLYYEMQMSDNYKEEEKELEAIVHKNIVPKEETKKIKLYIYYRSKKIK